MKKIILGIILSSIFLFYPCQTYAQGINVGVYPPIFQANTTPPADISTPLTVYNFSDSPIDLRIVIKPFKQAATETGEVTFIDNGATEDFIKKNVQVLNEENIISTISLAGKEIKKLSLKINIPEKQDHSDYYFSVIFMSDNLSISDTSYSQGGIATNVLVSIGPKGPTKGEIKEFSTPFYTQNGPVPFNIKIENSSGHFITPEGHVLIKNMFGQTIAKIDLLPVNILSNTARFIPDYQSYLSSIKDEEIKFDSKTFFWNEKFLLGFYTATLNISLSEDGPTFKRSINFLAFPIYALISIAVIIILLLIIRKRITKHLAH